MEVGDLTATGPFVAVDFLVDSGAFFTVLPEKHWKELGLEAKGNHRFSLADGTVVERPVGYALIRYGDLEGPCKIILGERDDSPLLGATALETLGLVLDPLKRRLMPAHMML
jgi:clan AA aspartic protease